MKQVALTLVLAATVLAPCSARADDKADCIAAFEAAQSLRADSKLTQAIPKFAVCARDVCPRSMQKACVDQAAEATALLPTVVLSATDASNSGVVDAKVSIDGVVVTTVLDGKAIPVDPGLHTFRFEKAGVAPVERRVAIKEGQKGQSVEAQLASPRPAAPAVASVAAPPVIAPAPVVAPPPPAREERRGSGSPLLWAGVGVGAAGVAGIGLGSVFGAMAFSKWNDAKAQCGNACAAGSPAYATRSTGETDATISTVAFVAGGVLAAGGVALIVAAPSSKSSTSAALAPTIGGLQMVGRF
jgi:hypothetical protein